MRMILILVAVLLGVHSGTSYAEQCGSLYDKALKAIIAESKVMDAVWMNCSTPSIYVGMFDDGTDRSGFADYVCYVAQDFGITPGLVKIVDIQKVMQKDGVFREIGRSYCKW